ncbi:hypothetical protein F4678DRAFT_130768 [Xylaria arbuscula]|nr:hypothetical protein F4678DRAFT_130768 [Xylaria arbuscula]
MEAFKSATQNLNLSSPTTTRIIYTTTAATGIALLAYSRHCYLQWHALGEGGIPHNLKGWLMNVAMHPFARSDSLSVPAPYEKSPTSTSASNIVLSAQDEERYGAATRASYFRFPGGSLPERTGDGRPTVPTTIAPQRQTTQKAGADTVERQNAFLAALAKSNASLFAIRGSGLESPRFPALWLSPSSSSPSSGAVGKADVSQGKWFPAQAPGETAHVHDEGSTHVCASLIDAAEIVRKGWGERHRLSGVKRIVPWGYVLVYAPREGNEEDWEVWKGIVVAAARCVAKSGGFVGEIVVPE